MHIHEAFDLCIYPLNPQPLLQRFKRKIGTDGCIICRAIGERLGAPVVFRRGYRRRA